MSSEDPQVYIGGLKNRLKQNPDIKKRFLQIIRAVKKGVIAPTIAAEEVIFFS